MDRKFCDLDRKKSLAEDAAELEAELSKALASDKPAVIEVPVGPMERRY